MEYYEVLGLAPSLDLDAADLKNRFYERSRQWHPDRFSRAGAAEREHALRMTAVINNAFRTLRDPVARAEYFLKESGVEPAQSAPPELLEEMFEWNMALEELRGGEESARPALEDARRRLAGMLAASDETLAGLFRRGQDRSVLEAVRRELDRRRYIANLVREVEKALDGNTAD